MNRETIFETWVPADGLWSLWARPILFAEMPDDFRPDEGEHLAPVEEGLQHAIVPEDARPLHKHAWRKIDISWAKQLGDGLLFVIDLPSAQSVWMGLALAGEGYRPVPMYNACTGINEVIPQKSIMAALRAGTEHLCYLPLPDDAPPAFLLDANRMRPERALQPLVFDNRWQVFPQDFPSASFLAEKGYNRVVLVQSNAQQPAEDLAHILRRWQEAGIRIDIVDIVNDRTPMPMRVERPPWYRVVWHRITTLWGLRPSWSGGFGSEIPEPPKSHG